MILSQQLVMTMNVALDELGGLISGRLHGDTDLVVVMIKLLAENHNAEVTFDDDGDGSCFTLIKEFRYENGFKFDNELPDCFMNVFYAQLVGRLELIGSYESYIGEGYTDYLEICRRYAIRVIDMYDVSGEYDLLERLTLIKQ